MLSEAEACACALSGVTASKIIISSEINAFFIRIGLYLLVKNSGAELPPRLMVLSHGTFYGFQDLYAELVLL